MADYQEYRRRMLRKRWRRRFMAAALLLLLLLVGAIGMLWKSLHREQRPSGVGQNTILQEVCSFPPLAVVKVPADSANAR